MNCATCSDLVPGHGKPAHCAYSGAHLDGGDRALSFTCPRALSLDTPDDRVVARTVLVVAQQRSKENPGLLERLLHSYPQRDAQDLAFLLTTEDADHPICGDVLNEREARRRFVEAGAREQVAGVATKCPRAHTPATA